MFSHAFRNALNPLINFGVAQVIYLMGIIVMLDTVFSFRGVGLTLVNAVRNEDTNFIMIVPMLTGITISLCMLAADIMIALIDPRVRYGKG